MKPTFRQLQYFTALADCGTFSAAARHCRVSQPSLSTQIADMEAVLGAPLVERGRASAPLTPLGRDIAARARMILRDMEELKTVAGEAGETLTGRIRLGTLPSVGPYLLPTALRRLHRDYPALRIIVREERTADLKTHLRDGKLDFVLSTPNDHADMRSAELFEEVLHIAVATDDPLASETGPVRLGALSGRELLTLGRGHTLADLVRGLAQRAGASVNSEYEGTSLDAVRQMAEMGGCVAVLPSLYALSEAVHDPGLVVRAIEDPAAQRTIALVTRPSSPLHNKFEVLRSVFAETARTKLSGHGPSGPRP